MKALRAIGDGAATVLGALLGLIVFLWYAVMSVLGWLFGLFCLLLVIGIPLALIGAVLGHFKHDDPQGGPRVTSQWNMSGPEIADVIRKGVQQQGGTLQAITCTEMNDIHTGDSTMCKATRTDGIDVPLTVTWNGSSFVIKRA